MMIQILTFLLVIISGILCSGTQQGVSSTQAGQTLQIQPNVRKYNKHTATEKPCTTGSTTGTRKDKPENSDSQDYIPIGSTAGPGYPYSGYPYAYPYPPIGPSPGGVLLMPGGNPYRLQYPYEPQYPVEAASPLPSAPYYAPYYPAPAQSPPPAYATLSYHSIPYPAPQPLYEQSTVVEAYRSPFSPYFQSAEQTQFFRQPASTAGPYYYTPQQSSSHIRGHTYNRPTVTPAFLQQRDASTSGTNTNNAEPQYEQQSGSFDNNQFHY